ANTAPNKVPIISAIRGGVFFKIKKITTIGTIKSQGVMTKDSSIVDNNDAVSGIVEVSRFSPIIVNKIKVIIKVGTVVSVMYRMWVNRSVPAIAGAKFVVSLNGDILSPK